MPLLSTVRAKFDGRGLEVIDRSPDLPGPPGDASLQLYLTVLSANGWNAVRGDFDGWDVILTFERQIEQPYKTGSIYMLQMLQQMPCPDGLSTAADKHMRLMSQLQETGGKEGWQVLAGPKHLAVLPGLWTIAIWVKMYPIS